MMLCFWNLFNISLHSSTLRRVNIVRIVHMPLLTQSLLRSGAVTRICDTIVIWERSWHESVCEVRTGLTIQFASWQSYTARPWPMVVTPTGQTPCRPPFSQERELTPLMGGNTLFRYLPPLRSVSLPYPPLVYYQSPTPPPPPP